MANVARAEGLDVAQVGQEEDYQGELWVPRILLKG